MGGSFGESESFYGEIAGVNIWDHVINEGEIRRLSKLCWSGAGNVVQWSDFRAHVKGSVQIVYMPSC